MGNLVPDCCGDTPVVSCANEPRKVKMPCQREHLTFSRCNGQSLWKRVWRSGDAVARKTNPGLQGSKAKADVKGNSQLPREWLEDDDSVSANGRLLHAFPRKSPCDRILIGRRLLSFLPTDGRRLDAPCRAFGGREGLDSQRRSGRLNQT